MGSASSFPNKLTLEDCKTAVGDEYYKEIFDAYKFFDSKDEQWVVDKNTLIGLQELETDVFFSHDWGVDENQQNNHDRVAKINNYLLEKGVKTWFDGDKMRGDIVEKMCNGINHTKLVIVFVTDNYIKKVASSNFNDNCLLEFKYAMRKKVWEINVTGLYGK